tara:strand:- start:886 stop:1554 length:669 start_codon:yes stop_codon:yes gene_type:complete
MRNWFNWQLKNQVENPDWPTEQLPVANLSESLGWFNAFILDGYQNKTLEYYYENVFYRQDWCDKASSTTDGAVDADTLSSWMHDPELSTLMDNQGVEYILNFPEEVTNKLNKQLSSSLNLIEDSINIRIHIQRPGQFFAIHFDRNKYGNYDTSRPAHDLKSHIFLVFLNDQSLGQVFQLGHSQIRWQEGDVFTWEQTDMPHGSANFGLENRYAMILTGFAKA